jgi:hypothetical protein
MSMHKPSRSDWGRVARVSIAAYEVLIVALGLSALTLLIAWPAGVAVVMAAVLFSAEARFPWLRQHDPLNNPLGDDADNSDGSR